MRIIGYIKHPLHKVTVFKDGGRVSIKTENGHHEQVYKFRDGSGVENLAQATAFADERYFAGVDRIFEEMAKLQWQSSDRQKRQNREDEFPEIV